MLTYMRRYLGKHMFQSRFTMPAITRSSVLYNPFPTSLAQRTPEYHPRETRHGCVGCHHEKRLKCDSARSKLLESEVLKAEHDLRKPLLYWRRPIRSNEYAKFLICLG